MSVLIPREAERDTWQYKAVEATRGQQSRLGCILLAVIGKRLKNPPKFGPCAVILKEGQVVANYQSKDGTYHREQFVCDVADLIANFRGLADHLNFTDAERVALFDAVRKWIVRDERVKK